MSQLLDDQQIFATCVGHLLLWATTAGYQVTLGDAWAKSGHCNGSFHYRRLAIDLNLFKDGRWLTTTEAHQSLGDFWKTLHPRCTWGGDFTTPDGNHYSFGESLATKKPRRY